MLVTCPELPSPRVGLAGAEVLLAFWYKQGCHGNSGARHLPPSLRWAQGAMRMTHVRDHMNALCLTLKGWSFGGWGDE